MLVAISLIKLGVNVRGTHTEVGGSISLVDAADVPSTYAAEKATQLGAKVVTMSDSTGWVYDPEGIDLAAVKEIKEVLKELLEYFETYHGAVCHKIEHGRRYSEELRQEIVSRAKTFLTER